MLSSASTTMLVKSAATTMSLYMLEILGWVMLVSVGILVFYFGWRWLLCGANGAGTTSRLGKHWAWYDHMTYRPYKGYNRLRSRRWNMEHTS